MIEVALLLGLGAVGYLLAKDQIKITDSIENFSVEEARPTEEIKDDVVHSQSVAGHNNQTPFYGARVTQSMYSGATDQLLDNHTGSGKDARAHSHRSRFGREPDGRAAHRRRCLRCLPEKAPPEFAMRGLPRSWRIRTSVGCGFFVRRTSNLRGG